MAAQPSGIFAHREETALLHRDDAGAADRGSVLPGAGSRRGAMMA